MDAWKPASTESDRDDDEGGDGEDHAARHHQTILECVTTPICTIVRFSVLAR